MKSLLIPIILRELPSFNSIALSVINFLVIALVFIVFRHDKFESAVSKIFGFLAVFMLMWVDFAYLARILGLYEDISILFLKIAWFATPFVFFCAYLISIYIMDVQNKYKVVSIAFFIITLVLAAAAGFTNLIINGIRFTQGILDIIYGVGFFPFMFGIAAIMAFTLLPIFRTKLTKSSKSFLVGVTIFYIANFVFNITLPVVFNLTHLYWLGDYSTIFLLGFTTYSIVRYRLFDVKVVLTEGLTIIIWTILFSRLFVSESLTGIIIDTSILVVMVVFGILLIKSVVKEVEQREKLEDLTQKLRAMDAQKNEFISMAAHELRAPMTAIKGYLSMVMEGDTGDIPEKARGFLADANNINERLVRLVNNMLNVSRVEEGRMVYQMEADNLSRVVRVVYNQFIPEAERKGLKYALEIPNHIKDRVKVDPDRIQEVIGNFLSNAVKYTQKGSVTVKLDQPNSSSIKCEVVDTGPGISKEEQRKLFQKFYRVESNVGKTTGTGLGLYISRLLVEKFGGKIGINSDVGEGSTFWFELPLVPA